LKCICAAGAAGIEPTDDLIGGSEEEDMADSKEQLGSNATCEIPETNSNSDRVQSILKAVEAALLIASLLLAGIYLTARIEGYLASQSALEKFDAVKSPTATGQLVTDESPSNHEPDFRTWGEGRVRAYQDSTKRSFGVPLAILTIPSVHLQAPVFDGTDAITLNHAVGRIAGTGMPGEDGNIGIAGHRDGFFRGLKDIKQGDEIDLKTHNGTDIYTVESIQIVSPRDMRVLRVQERPAVTLITCYPFYFVGSAPKRFVVTAFLTQHNPAGQMATEARLNSQLINSPKEER
jgi:sortase A